MFAQGYRNHGAELGLLVNNETTFNKLPVACESRDSEQSLIFPFLFGVVIWLDIVSCVNTGKSPHLLDLHPLAFDSKAQIRLEKIMGCKNWVMTELGRISQLHSSKRDEIQGGIFDAHSFENQAEHIRQTIRRGLNEQFLTELRITNSDSTSPTKPKISPQEIITRIFSRAAYVYLELVVGGFKRIEENPDLRNIITEPMMMLPTLPRGDIFRAIVCPLYILGCVANSEYRDIFRDIFSSPPLKDPSMHHRSTILPLLEKVWILRDANSNNVSWEMVLQLSDDKILLL